MLLLLAIKVGSTLLSYFFVCVEGGENVGIKRGYS
jgi:hypothetical protein